MASIKDVAKRAGVSTATVSRVLNNHPSVVAETRKVVREAMDYLCYVPSKSSFQLSGKCSGLIGVVVPNLVNPHFCELLATVEEKARYIGKSVIVKTHQKFAMGADRSRSRSFRMVNYYPNPGCRRYAGVPVL